MLISKSHLLAALRLVLQQRLEQGAAIDRPEFEGRIAAAADSYDALHGLAVELADPPLRKDWPYTEPLLWSEIVAESQCLKPSRAWDAPDLDRAAECARAGFLGSVCGCMLGKPLEVDPTLAELRAAGEPLGEWPLCDYVSCEFLDRLGRRHDSWRETTRGNIAGVVADDDIHYTLIGMCLLERHGTGFTTADLCDLWEANLAPGWTWGPERTRLLTAALARHHLFDEATPPAIAEVLLLNPGDEMCGALIRADAYGYACPGNPDLAAWLAWKDASFTHIKTGVYGAMFVAALIALCHTLDAGAPPGDRLDLVLEALKRVPGRTRFAAVVVDAVDRVARCDDWLTAYESVHDRYGEFSHCRVYQEIGTLINTLRFAHSIGHGIGLQVSQGNDTDSFGATAGSMLGVLFGGGYLDNCWTAPLENRLEHGLAGLDERRLDALADRVAALPGAVYGEAGRR